jgi:hypothetical protein
VATEAAGTPAARFLPLPFSSLGQLVQPLNMGCIENWGAVASSNSDMALEDSTIRQMKLRTPPEGVTGLATHQGGPVRTRRPQGSSPQDGLARGVNVLFAQKSRAQVRGRNDIVDDGACLLRIGVSGLLGDLGA